MFWALMMSITVKITNWLETYGHQRCQMFHNGRIFLIIYENTGVLPSPNI